MSNGNVGRVFDLTPEPSPQGRYLPLSGGTLTGPLILPANGESGLLFREPDADRYSFIRTFDDAEGADPCLKVGKEDADGVGSIRLGGVATPHTADDAATKGYVDGTALIYGSNGAAGKFDRLTAAPTATSPLRYNGVFRATKVFGIYFSDSADLAETYAVEGAWEWGDLIAIGADGLFRRNETPENRHVLGFASQRPGVVLGGVDGVPIALAGRVPVRAEGVICAGDFLSAGTEPGTVRTADPDTAPRGSIVAMALEDKLASGVGPVLALVQRM